jgi:hypothetical protein
VPAPGLGRRSECEVGGASGKSWAWFTGFPKSPPVYGKVNLTEWIITLFGSGRRANWATEMIILRK